MPDMNTFYQPYFQVWHQNYYLIRFFEHHNLRRTGFYLIVAHLNSLVGDSIVILIGYDSILDVIRMSMSTVSILILLDSEIISLHNVFLGIMMM